ncbi:PP2C family protein-serine/threonine phosphatase [Geminisphaera colitermitum]|uniref:PP2C family protein-serine/threonine phosphatase n=1 Tax=Geminisphaera colitermitum TaxID=1148786 RepID=UPI0001965484|nr:protein phosphatase 2C domain-containing protein [Geminisphaera colitermitum]
MSDTALPAATASAAPTDASVTANNARRTDAPSRPLRLHWSGMTHIGRFRTNNEDSFLALNFDAHEVHYLGKTGDASPRGADFVFAVSDGMGGANSGEFASKIAVTEITRLLPRSFKVSALGLSSGFTDILTELFEAIHASLINLGHSYEECAGMGATLSLCWVTPEWIYFGHIGDSRIYYLPRTGGITQLTHDHSHVGWLRRTKRITEHEARAHPGKNSLQQALGAGNQHIEPHIGAVGLQAGDRFIICSDGLTDGLWDSSIERLLREPTTAQLMQDPARRLVEESVNASGRDNTTAVVIEILPDGTASV